jgi:hypothetical protein
MDIENLFTLEHLLFSTRKCRSCGKEKDLLSDYYKTRKNRGAFPSSYSYECKCCTVERIIESRKLKTKLIEWEYPDW